MQERMPRGRDYFVDDNSEEAGIPWDNFLTALQVWSWMRPGAQASVREAAEQFGVTDDVIRTAVKQHHWMFLDGPSEDDAKLQVIGHDGE